jgi:hypothetical protein
MEEQDADFEEGFDIDNLDFYVDDGQEIQPSENFNQVDYDLAKLIGSNPADGDD